MSSDDNPRCIFCLRSEPRPCAPGGAFDASFLALTYLEYVKLSDRDRDAAEKLFWAYNCMSDIENADPELAFQVTLLMIDSLSNVEQAAVVAAGPLENLIQDNGPLFIDRIETLAHTSSRFRFVLTGVWGSEEATPVWPRIEALQKSEIHIDSDASLPISDLNITKAIDL